MTEMEPTHQSLLRAIQTNRWAIGVISTIGGGLGGFMLLYLTFQLANTANALDRVASKMDTMTERLVEVQTTQKHLAASIGRVDTQGTVALRKHAIESADEAHR